MLCGCHVDAASVVIVSDCEDHAQRPWHTERGLLQALARQDFPEPFEVILVENERYRNEIPPDLPRICPRSRIVFSAERQSAKLKNVGACSAKAELVAVLDADCLPNDAWLRVLVTVLRERPDVSAVSGRTHYGEETSYRRALSLVDRAFDDLGRPGLTPRVSTNAALYRRSLLTRFPYPDSATPFGSAMPSRRQKVAARTPSTPRPGASAAASLALSHATSTPRLRCSRTFF